MKKQTGEDSSEKLAEKILQFENLPDECLACLEPFDKKSNEMARTWNVVIREKNTVRLYCPKCWKTAKNTIEQIKKEFTNDRS